MLPSPSRQSIYWLLLLLFFFCGVVHAEDVVKSPNDPRTYAVMTLDNGLRVILVSDPDTDKAAASMNVNIGSFQDPEGRAGLAHFLEHMLFLGTAKYPDANEYKEFISSHGGMDNAFTSSEHTSYFFDIDKDFLDETLDRFAQFFIAPLFNEAYVQREMNAVDSEYRLKIKDDGRRIYEVLKATANQQHPFSKFSVGNLDSLKDREHSKTRDELIQFYNKYYSANLMTLAILGKEPIEELKKMTGRFNAIINHHTQIATIKAPLYTGTQLRTRVNIIPLQDLRSLTLSFAVPWHDSYYLQKPFQILAHLIGYEGENSLHALLKGRGWINGLAAGSGAFAGNYVTFDIDIDLTEEGLKHTDEITRLVFQTIDLVREHGVERWIHDEIQQLNDLNFRFHEKGRASNEVVTLASNLQHYPARLAVKGPYISEDFSAQREQGILAALNSDNLRQIIIAPKLETDKTEPYYATAYSIKPLPERLVNNWRRTGSNPLLAIPPVNPFIPEHTEVLAAPVGQDKPELIMEQPDFSVWHRQDEDFNVPRANISIGLTTAATSETLRQSMMSSLFTALVNDNLNEFAYPAALAGLHYHVGKGERGIGLSVGGYDDKQQVLLSRIIDTMMTFRVDPERFAVIKQRMKQDWQNTHLDRPYRQLNRALNTLLSMRSWTPDAYLEIIDDISVAELEKHIDTLWKQAYIRILIHGNIDRKHASEIATNIIQRVRKRVKPAPALERETVKLVAQATAHRFNVDIDHNDSAIISYYQGPDGDTRTQARSLLLLQILETPFFNQLRTREQLGYVVYAGQSNSLRIPAIKFVVQSPVKGPQDLLGHIDHFLQQQFKVVKSMEADEFETNKQAILTRLLEKDKRLDERTRRYQNSLALKYLDFNHRDDLADAIRRLTREDVGNYYEELLLSNRQSHIVIESTGNKHPGTTQTVGDNTPGRKLVAARQLTMETIKAFRASQDDYSLKDPDD